MRTLFADRADAGRALATALEAHQGADDTVVLGLPRGGVPVAYEVAMALDLPLDVLVVRKLGLPWQPELAMGAIASGGALVSNDEIVRHLGGDRAAFEAVRLREQAELERREREFRGEQPPLDLHDLAGILVDDGLATGATMEAAVRALRVLGARRVVVAVPVASREALARITAVADQVTCLATPMLFSAVGQWYGDFAQTSNEEVRDLLSRARARLGGAAKPGGVR